VSNHLAGFLLGLSLLLTPIGVIVLSWFGRTADAKRVYQQDLAKREETIRGLRTYQQQCRRQYPLMEVTMADYRRYLGQQPKVNAPFHKSRSVYALYYWAAAVCLGLEVILVICAFVHWQQQPMYSLVWGYTGLLVIVLLWWWWALMESTMILPEYARSHHHRPLIPPLPER